MKRLSLILIALFALNTYAKSSNTDLNGEMDALGANQELMKKAKAIDPDNKVRVVQNRDVDRNMRFELGVNYGMYAAGTDAYFSTQQIGGQLDFHINPHWSLGARYTSYNNQLNSEGKQVSADIQSATAAGNLTRVPSLTYATNSWLGVVNFYPIYGKLNLFDASIAQFDMYLIAGAGGINTSLGSAPLYTAGAGIGVWLTNHVATRFEARWQGYNEKQYDGSGTLDNQQINELVLQATLSFML